MPRLQPTSIEQPMLRRLKNFLKYRNKRRNCGDGFNCLAVSDKKNDIGFPVLPDFIQLEILSFIYDEIDLVSVILATIPCQFGLSGLRRHLSLSIQSNEKNRMTCRICDSVSCYPYRLVDCGHIVCGRCLWMNRCVTVTPCPCGCAISSRPKRLDPHLADSQAHWILTSDGTFYVLIAIGGNFKSINSQRAILYSLFLFDVDRESR